MIRLNVVGDDVIDVRGIDDCGDAREQFVVKTTLHCVDEGDLLVEDEVCIIGGTALRVVAVKAAHRPVNGSDPVNIIPDFDGVHE